jgi:hypothetical protein
MQKNKLTVEGSRLFRALLFGTITPAICLSSAYAAQVRGIPSRGLGDSSRLMQQELERGLDAGRMTTLQASQIRTHEQNLQSHLQEAKSQNQLTSSERARLEEAQDHIVNKVKTSTARSTHHRTNPLSQSTHEIVQSTRKGVANGSLTRTQAEAVKSREQAIENRIEKARTNGQLNDQTRDKLQREQEQLLKQMQQAESSQPQG